MAIESIPAYSVFRSGAVRQAYNEAAFRYFLEADRRRIARAERSVFLVLASMRQEPGRNAPLADETAAALLAGLTDSVREVDFVGWYREGRLAGAVLPQAAGAAGELGGTIAKRIITSINKFLSADEAGRLRVRVVRLDGKAQR
jgi:hypothetical protein